MSIGLEFVWREFEQAALDFFGVIARRQIRPIGDAKHVRVDRDRRLAEHRVQHHVRRLASDTGQRLQRCTIARNFATVLLHQRLRQPDHVARLGAIEAGRMDVAWRAVLRRA